MELHVPRRDELRERQTWLLNPEMMSFNAGWNIPHPGYDNDTGCIAWPTSDWDSFLVGYSDPRQAGYFYLLDRASKQHVGHVHYRVNADGVAEVGVNIVPAHRGRGLGREALNLLLDRIWSCTDASTAINQFEDERASAVRLHRTAGFIPGKVTTLAGRRVRQWRLARPA